MFVSRVAFVLTTLVVCALATMTHPNHIQTRYRGGRVYREAKQAHDQMIRDNNIYVNYTANTFQQLLNHSDPNSPTFTQRYWVDYSAWDGNGPAMLYINGEAPASSSPTGYSAQYGHSKNAILFTLENRYYGESMPSNLTDYAMLSQYLSVDFALDDLRNFMRFVESTEFLGKTLRWFIVGGSYSGAVSAWFKQKYPSAVLAAWSSSGVVEAQFNFYDYDGHVGAELPPVCRQSIETVLDLFSSMWDNETTRPSLLAKFNVPSYFLKADMSYMLADAAAGAVQYGQKWALCDAIVPQSKTDPLGQYNDMIVDLWGASFANGCYYSTMCLSNKSMSQYWAGAGYSWLYQTCSQMAYFQVGYYNSVRRAEVSTDYFVNQCRLAFTSEIFPDVYAFNAKYGGLTPDATNVIALQGSDDPWSTTGVRKSLGPLYPAVIAECEDCGHCGDLMTPLASDPPSLVAQREQIAHYMDIWLASQPQSYQMILNGNFSMINADPSARALIAESLLLDIRAAIDQSVKITALTTGSLIVDFTLEINTLNSNIVLNNLQASGNNTSWLSRTAAAFTQIGGQGNFTMGSITVEGSTSAPASSCGPSCVVGILFGCVGFLLVVGFIAVRISKTKKPSDAFSSAVSEKSELLE